MLGLSNLVLLKEIVLGTCFFCDEVWEWGIFFIMRASAGWKHSNNVVGHLPRWAMPSKFLFGYSTLFFQMRDTPCQEEMAWCWKFSEETTPMSPQQGIRFWYQGLEHKQLEWFMSTNLLYCSWTCMERTRHHTLKTAFPFTPLSFPHPDIQNGKAVVSMNPITWNYPPTQQLTLTIFGLFQPIFLGDRESQLFLNRLMCDDGSILFFFFLTSWGTGSWNPMIYKVFYNPGESKVDSTHRTGTHPEKTFTNRP